MPALKRFLREEEEQMGLVKDYWGIYVYCRLLSNETKKEGSEANHCCQVFANFSASVTKFIRHIFCLNFVLINFAIHKLCSVYNLLLINFVSNKLCYIAHKKLAIKACHELATLYFTVYLYCTEQIVCIRQCFVYKSASNPSSFILLGNLYPPL